MKQLLIIIFISLSQFIFGEEISLSFEKLPELLEQNNLDFRAVGLERDAQYELTGHLRRSFIPTVKANLGSANTAETVKMKTQNYQFLETDVDFNVFNGGRDRLEENIRNSNLEISQTKIEQVKFNALTSLRRLYWELIYQKEIVSILEKSITLTQDNKKAAQLRISAGLSTTTDKIDFEQSEIQYQQDLKRANIIYENIQREIIAILNFPLESVLKTEPFISHNEQDIPRDSTIEEFNAGEHRDFRFLNLKSNLTNFEKIKYARWWSPELDLYVGLTKRSTIPKENAYTVVQENGFVGGLRLTFQFDGFNSQATSSSRYYQSLAYDHYKKQKKYQLDAEFINAKKLLNLNHDLVHSSEENIKKSEHYLRNTRSEYSRGVKNSPDVLQASQRLITAQIRFADIKRNYEFAKIEILNLRGK